jgi:Mrp family chromosome partitioning ATPase
MSVSDHAFIKVYGAVSPTVSPTADSSSSGPEATAVPDEPLSVASALQTFSTVVVQDVPAYSVPEPHFDMEHFAAPTDEPVDNATATEPADSPTAQWDEEQIEVTSATYRPAPSTRALSSFFQPTALATQEAPIAPALEVESFQWPSACQRIERKAPKSLARIASELISAATRGQRVVAVLGCHRSEGATTILQCIAHALSEADCRTLIADADLQQPHLAERLGVLPEAGWDDVLSGSLQLPDVLISSRKDKLVLLPMRRPHTSGKGASQVQQSVIVALLRDQYDLMLLDTGPVMEDGGQGLAALAGSGVIDAAVVVCNSEITTPAQVDDAVKQLAEHNIPCAGVIENFVRRRRKGTPTQEAA